ncbi:hypothetical protein ARMGADRAFT_528120 [Armillaria gallica]|uniref:Uncharacterized protein n=1 Tax=Armillaria gallica TaxID=47427 RepID=A0A2H3DXY3_ARMGA|nr:hypothetical protein ARMGADRAFT_528120 [Armillaria gallica]
MTLCLALFRSKTLPIIAVQIPGICIDGFVLLPTLGRYRKISYHCLSSVIMNHKPYRTTPYA